MGNTSTKEGIANNITQLIGNTPMLRLNKVNDGFGNIVLKMEGENPAKSERQNRFGHDRGSREERRHLTWRYFSRSDFW